MVPRHAWVFGSNADMAPAARIVGFRELARLGDGKPAAADLEVDRRVDFREIELHQHVVAGNAEMRRTEGDEGRGVEAARELVLEVRQLRGARSEEHTSELQSLMRISYAGFCLKKKKKKVNKAKE